MDEKISILIVDDHEIFRNGLKQLLSRFNYVGEIQEASNGKEFLRIIESSEPDIVFMDIDMPIMGGIEATQKALSTYPNLKIIVLTTFHDEEYLDQMMLAGVNGYMLKRSTMPEFDTAIRKVHLGGNFFSDEIVSILTRNLNKSRNDSSISSKPKFTERETEILNLICKGFNNEQIGKIIHLSPKTIEKHKSSLFQKTDTKNTVNLIIYVLKNGLMHIDNLPD
ncbi:MAG: response regulator transcription factor [Salinivirgaceae bacterium]|jgi:DNA-binding NarL/FixJ family response regulator|nr:response regulator transcription factor [Salinivirgaceae bacterium]